LRNTKHGPPQSIADPIVGFNNNSEIQFPTRKKVTFKSNNNLATNGNIPGSHYNGYNSHIFNNFQTDQSGENGDLSQSLLNNDIIDPRSVVDPNIAGYNPPQEGNNVVIGNNQSQSVPVEPTTDNNIVRSNIVQAKKPNRIVIYNKDDLAIMPLTQLEEILVINKQTY
jgi:hypothetical protein